MEPTLILHAALAACLFGTGLFRYSHRQAGVMAQSAAADDMARRERRRTLQAKLWVMACLDHVTFAVMRHPDSRLGPAKDRLNDALSAIMAEGRANPESGGLEDWLSVRLDTLIRDTDRFSASGDEAGRTAFAATLHALADAIEGRLGIAATRNVVSIADQIAALKVAPAPDRKAA